MEQTLRVGVITSTHGVRGEVKVFPTTDDAKRFKKLKHVMIDTGKELKPMAVSYTHLGSINTVKVTRQTIDCVDRALQGEDYSQGALYFMYRGGSRSGRCV